MSDGIPTRSDAGSEAGGPGWRVEWCETFSVGIRDIDEEHRRLVVAVNELAAAVAERRGADACVDTLRQISRIARGHFAREARLMRASDCPDSGEHGRGAARLIAEVGRLEDSLRKDWAAVEVDRVRFLGEWITQHVAQTCAFR